MTTQSCISGQSIGTSTNKGNGVFSISPKTLASTTTAYVVSVQLTNGAGPVETNQCVVVYYTTTMRTVTSGNAPAYLGQTARSITLRPASNNSGIAIADSALEPVTGSKFHLWVNAPTFDVAGTLDVDLVELP